MRTRTVVNQRGIALIMVMLLTVAVAALAAGAIFLTSNATLVARGQEREEEMRNAADAGIEFGRSTLNGGSVLLDTIYRSLVLNAAVNDANGNPIPRITRSIYYGPTGSSTGQYGIFASVVSVITDASGAVVVRRGELAQESFARFAYYTDDEGTGICFGGMDNIFGPLHTNDDMCIYNTGAHFYSSVEIAGNLTGAGYGIFDVGYIERGQIIPLPTLADLARLNIYATQGGMSYASLAGGTSAQSRMRIEFVAIDLDGNGRNSDPDEGFFRIWENTTAVAGGIDYTMADDPGATNTDSRNCGHFHSITEGAVTRQVFVSAWEHKNTATANIPGHTGGSANEGNAAADESLRNGTFRCYLGGDEHLYIDSLAVPVGNKDRRNTFRANDAFGAWRLYTNTPDARVVAGLANPATAPAVSDVSALNRGLHAQYLFPVARAFNPNSKGVIYVAGKVAISGVLNGRVTLASDDNIVIADDLRYAVTPGSAPCQASNILGLLSPDTIFLADNTLNNAWDNGGFRTYDETVDETIQAVMLTLRSFYVENHSTGPNNAQSCGATVWGRGCLGLTGGIIQDTRGAVGQGNGNGYLKRYSYDVCAFQTPPPYFPTTGRYIRNRYYEIDPVGFNVASFFEDLAPTNP